MASIARRPAAVAKPKKPRKIQPCKVCQEDVKLEITPKCAVCKANDWKKLCDKCVTSRLLPCSHCGELSCSICCPPAGKDEEGDGWQDPCPDPRHVGTNLRFCYDCTSRCESCGKHVCNACFMSKADICRLCILKNAEELAEFDDGGVKTCF